MQNHMYQANQIYQAGQRGTDEAGDGTRKNQGVIRLADIVDCSIVDGLGVRMAIFTQGCPHRCEGCHNPYTHDVSGGRDEDILSVIQRMEKRKRYLNGITLTGGEPFIQAEGCAKIAEAAKEMGLTVWCYTGFTFEQLMEMSSEYDPVAKLLSLTDVLVDGPYVKKLRSLDILFRGSSNQRLIDAAESIREGKAVLYDDDCLDMRHLMERERWKPGMGKPRWMK